MDCGRLGHDGADSQKQMDIFDFDISPTGPAKKRDLGACAVASEK